MGTVLQNDWAFEVLPVKQFNFGKFDISNAGALPIWFWEMF